MQGQALYITVAYMCIHVAVGLYSMAKLSVGKDAESRVCPPCDTRACPVVTVDTCSGRMMPDQCGCCPVCNMTAGNMTGGTENTSLEDHNPEACKQVECPKHQMCLLNIQGIPVCRCPSNFYCRSRPRREVCSEEGKTYRSLCYLKMQACDENRKIVLKHKGPCEGDDEKIRQQRIDRQNKKKQEKKEKRLEKKNKKEARKEKKRAKKEQAEQPKLKRRNQDARQQRKKEKEQKNGNGQKSKKRQNVDKNTDRKNDRKERKELREERRRHRRRLRKNYE